MRILEISNYYYPHVGGIEQVARDCAKALKEENEVMVFCFNHERHTVENRIDDVDVVRPGCFAKISSQSLSLSYGVNLKKTFKNFKPELVIFHYPNPFAARYLLKLLKDYPECKLAVYWHLDIYKQKFLKKFFHGQNLKLLKRADKVIATSPNYIEGSPYLSAFKEKCAVIPNCVSDDKNQVTEEVLKKSEEIKKSAENKTICFACGRHVPYKGIEYLIRASRFLDDGFVVNIAGSGPLTKKLKKLAAGDKKVNMLGKISDEDLIANLIACDIFCFPSVTKNEAFGIALAEAMRFGKPSVTFNIPDSGVNYVSLNGITGIEVENGNSVKFAKAIKKIASDKDLAEKFSAAAKERVEENFTYEKFKKNINELIKSV